MNMVWLVVSAAVLAMLQSLIFKLWALKRLEYRRYFDRTAVFEGEKVNMVEVIANHKLLPLPWVRVESRMPAALSFKSHVDEEMGGDMFHSSIFFIGPFRRITRVHEITCRKRGAYSLGNAALTAGDILGLVDMGRQEQLNLEVLVYPRILNRREVAVPSHRWQGDILQRRWIDQDPFLINGIRDWQTGDSLRDVHWPATARTGEIKIKNRDYTASPKLLLALNVQITEEQWSELRDERTERIEQGISLVATYAAWAMEQGVEMGFMCNAAHAPQDNRSIELPPGAGYPHFIRLMELLARLRILQRCNFFTFMEKEMVDAGLQDYDIVIVSAYWSQRMEGWAGRLRSMGNSVTWIPMEEKTSHEISA